MQKENSHERQKGKRKKEHDPLGTRHPTVTLSKNVNSRRTPCFPTDAKDWSLEQENFIFFCGDEKKFNIQPGVLEKSHEAES